MDISRGLALAVLGLKDGYSEKELSDSYRRLAKITHPDSNGDSNLFRLVKECKDLLSKELTKPTVRTSMHKKRDYESTFHRESVSFSVKELQENFLVLGILIRKYDIRDILAYCKITIYPCFKKSKLQSHNIVSRVTFDNFLQKRFLDFQVTTNIPSELVRYKLFRVKVEFLDSTHSFLIWNNSKKKITHNCIYFNSILTLHFVKNN